MDEQAMRTDVRTAESESGESAIAGNVPTRRRGWRLYLGAAIAAVVVLGGGWWLYQQFTHVLVDDARVAADMVTLSSRVAGKVTAINVVAGDSVAQGRVLLRIDDRQSRLKVQALKAQLAEIGSSAATLQARLVLTNRQTQSAIAAQQAAINAAEANLKMAVAQRDLAAIDNRRAVKLFVSGSVSRSRVDHTRTALATAVQQVSSARAELAKARAVLVQAQAERHQLTVLNSELAALAPQRQRLQAQLGQAELDVGYHTISMPFNGVIDRRFVVVGNYVTPGQRLLMLHNPLQVRVDANVKETEIRYFHPGKSVRVTVDALPGRTFSGTVARVGQAATSEFALLPNPNPSGNFTKITQRLPVRIAIRQHDDQLKPGMMVEVRASE